MHSHAGGDRHHDGFQQVTLVAEARERLLAAIEPVERTETVPLVAADGRVTAEALSAAVDVPAYDRAAMDGWAVQAEDTYGASPRRPEQLEVLAAEAATAPTTAVRAGGAVRVHTGSQLPVGADAIVMLEQAEEVDGHLEVSSTVSPGTNVAPTGEDISADQQLYPRGHRLRPSDLGLLRSVGQDVVSVVARPQVAVLPTGEEVVEADPGPGEVIETNGLTVSRLIERWGATASYRDVVTDDPEALAAALRADIEHDLIVTTGGSSVGSRDLLPEVVEGMGTVTVHGVALKPGHPVALGVIEATPVVMLPGYPVAAIINAMQFVRPAVAALLGVAPPAPPTRRGVLTRKIVSEPGVRSFVRVRTERSDAGRWEVEPVMVGGSGVLSSVALADGWVVVDEPAEGVDAGEEVTVEYWEGLP
jgi:molybdopterin molybdochelatase